MHDTTRRLTSSWFFLRYFLVKYLRYRLEKGVEAVKTSLAPDTLVDAGKHCAKARLLRKTNLLGST